MWAHKSFGGRAGKAKVFDEQVPPGELLLRARETKMVKWGHTKPAPPCLDLMETLSGID